MSRTKNGIVTMLKDFEDILRSRTYLRKGKKLNAKQNHIYCDALVLLFYCWYDCIQSKTSDAKPRWALPWVRIISQMDVSDLAVVFKSVDDYLLQNAENGWTDYDRFKHDLTLKYPLTGQVIAPLKGLIADLFCEFNHSTQESFSLVHMCLTFMGRLNLPGLKDLQAEAYAAYVEGEHRLKIDGFTDLETRIIQSWFPYVSLSTLLNEWYPKHGSGAVADVKIPSKEEKYLAFGRDSMIDRLDLILGGNTLPYIPTKALDRTARVVFVPKSISKLRTICMEPTTLQWYQQGFMHSIVDYINNHSYLSRRINLADQELSQDLAYDGSIDGGISTIDLSSASDSVSWPLVKMWTRRSSLLPICGLTRSKNCVLPDGKVMATKKFAPMGSALCFPIECIIFSAIVEAAILTAGGRPRDSLYRVYGDDIIVETRYAQSVIDRLEYNGFTVNHSKSFFTVGSHNFRESCGGEFLDGVDVTPIRLSRRFAGFTDTYCLDASSIAACVDLCNLCYRRLPTVRRMIIRSLMELPYAYRPVFDSSGEKGIFSPNPTNYHLPDRFYRARYQSFWLRHGGIHVCPSSDVTGSLALYEQLRATYKRKSLFTPEDVIDAVMALPGVETWRVMTSCVDELGSQPSLPVEKRKPI